MIRHPAAVRGEVCTFTTPAPLAVRGVSAVLRERQGLSNLIATAQDYLRVESATGIEGWYGPFVQNSGVTTLALAEHLRIIGPGVTVASALEALGPVWDVNPGVCAAIETVLWDLTCRTMRVPLWRLLNPHGARSTPRFYASALGLSSEHSSVLRAVVDAGYPIAKWTVNSVEDLAAQISSIAAVGIPWRSIALDAHGGLDHSCARHLHRLAPNLAWLEDPCAPGEVWHDDGLPRIVIGESLHSPEELLYLSRLPGVHAVNLEIERLGVTRACKTVAGLRRPCLLHGRAIPLSLHFAAAFPAAVRAVESHLMYMPERLATLCPEDKEFDSRRLWARILTQPGCATAPSPAARLVAREDILHA